MHDKLPRLPCTAREESPEDGHVKPSLHGAVCHMHIRCLSRCQSLLIRTPIRPGPAASSVLGAVAPGEVTVVHRHDGRHPRPEHVLPFALADVLAVIAARHRLCRPFLLEEGLVIGEGGGQAREVVEIDLVP